MNAPMNPATASKALGPFASWFTLHARALLLGAVGLVMVCTVVGGSLLSIMSNATDDPHSPSARALAAVQHASGTSPGADDLTLVVHLGSAWPAPAARVQLDAVRHTLAAISGVVDVSASDVVSADGRAALITAGIDASRTEDTVTKAVTKTFDGDHAVGVGGPAAINLELDDRIAADLGRAELIVFPILFLLGIWIFRGVIAALVPITMGGFTVIVTLGVLRVVATVTTLSEYVLNLVIGLGLGLAVDYSLFLISRYREEIRVDGYGTPAVFRATRHAGRTVLFSAATVACALATLMLFPQRFLYSMGIGGVAVTAVAALIAVSFVPAALIVLGPRIDALAPNRWKRAREVESRDPCSGRWYQLSRAVMARARWVLPATALFAVLLSLPALWTKFSAVDQSVLPTSSHARQVTEQVASLFGQGDSTTVFAVIGQPASSAVQVQSEADALVAVARDGAQAVAPARYIGDGLWVAQLRIRGDASSSRAGAAVRRLRATSSESSTLIGGDAAEFVDLQTSIGKTLPAALAVVVLAVLLVMLLFTGSVVLAVKTVVLNGLNVAMTFGLLVMIFQWGNLESVLNFQSVGAIDLNQPILVAVIAFGLSTDYGVFLFSRIKEAHDHGLDDIEAVSVGLGRSGRIISSAALLLCIAIGAFSSSSVLFIKELGVGAAAAVILDAALVRSLLVPSAMSLMGKANWWAPAPVVWLCAHLGLREDSGTFTERPSLPEGAQDPVAPRTDVEAALTGLADVADPALSRSNPSLALTSSPPTISVQLEPPTAPTPPTSAEADVAGTASSASARAAGSVSIARPSVSVTTGPELAAQIAETLDGTEELHGTGATAPKEPTSEVAPTKGVPAKRTAPAKKATAAKKATPAKKAAPAKKAVPAKKVVPAKKATAANKATPAKKAAPAKKAVPAKKAAPAKKVTPARRSPRVPPALELPFEEPGISATFAAPPPLTSGEVEPPVE